MRWAIRSVAICAVLAMTAGCGGDEGPIGPAGDASEIQTERFEEHDDCAAGGVEVLVDDQVSAVVCDGEQGETGDQGEEGDDGDHGITPDVTADRVEAHEECPAGGVLISVSFDGGEAAETVVCDGDDGEPGQNPTIDVEELDETISHDCGDVGGYLITATSADGDVTETILCHGAPGDVTAPEVTVETDDNLCDGNGGAEVTVGNAEPVVICNGEQGEPGDSPTVEFEDVEETSVSHDCGDAGGYLVTVTSADETDVQETVICNGSAGLDGDGAISIAIEDDPAECDAAGGVKVTIANEDPFLICNGEAGYSPVVDVETLEPNAAGPCVEGGVYVSITSVGSEGEEVVDEFTICAGSEALPEATLDWCNTEYPTSVDMNDDEAVDISGYVEVEGYTGDQGGALGEDYAAELGYGVVGGTPDDGTWNWIGAELNEDSFFTEDNQDEFVAEVANVEAGSYEYLYRVTLDGAEWTYCGLEGIVDVAEYDAAVDAGPMEISVAPEVIVGWTFDGDSLDPSFGSGYARFSDGTESDPVGSSTFFGGASASHWAASNWTGDTSLPTTDPVAMEDYQYFRFASDFSGYDSIQFETTFRRTSTGPSHVHVAAEFDDGTLAFLGEPIELPTTSDDDQTVNVTPAELVGDHEDTDVAVAYRIYGFDASGTGNMRILDIEFSSF